jgi:hypothetical protein
VSRIFGNPDTDCGHRECEVAQARYRPLIFVRCFREHTAKLAAADRDFTQSAYGSMLATARYHQAEGGPVVVTMTDGTSLFATAVAEVGDTTVTFYRGQRRQTVAASGIASVRRIDG